MGVGSEWSLRADQILSLSDLQSGHQNTAKMEAIKKKVQAMKVEKDNLCDRCDEVEQKMKDALIRRDKAEEEFTELNMKSKTLEIDLDKFAEKLEEDLEITEQKYVLAIQKYDKAATAADDSDRMAKVLQNRATEDETKLSGLADELKKAQHRAEEADKKYDEAQKKMVTAEGKLEIDGERADVSEFKIIELEEELKVVANNLKSLEVSEDKANKREDYYKTEIKRLTGKLKQSETRAEF